MLKIRFFLGTDKNLSIATLEINNEKGLKVFEDLKEESSYWEVIE